MNHNRFIQVIFGSLFVIISGASFALSYMNLMAAAIEAGIIPLLAPLWPLCLDAFIVMSSLFILQANLNNESNLWGWIALLLSTVASVGFNIAHSPVDLFSQAAHAIPPVMLCASLELLMIRIKRDLLKSQRDSEEMENPLAVQYTIPQEKVQKVLEWFTENPGGKIEDARKSLRMSHATVSKCRAHLISDGKLSGLTE